MSWFDQIEEISPGRIGDLSNANALIDIGEDNRRTGNYSIGRVGNYPLDPAAKLLSMKMDRREDRDYQESDSANSHVSPPIIGFWSKLRAPGITLT